ncbi:hypothetical protein [Longimicrobium sp.]|uniref:hypothetical protein n=1 Tax=Longimicrobium sp. TaxID=2029185 RepID=UPI002E32EB43|nr:hypothetical protein [Longimicrobium sp.]HEX6037995.1 hypothetical protein [Longimicrobium sp.]
MNRIKRVLYVVPVLGAMVFGATQVFASPVAQKEARACSKNCWQECGPAGGVCNRYGVCVCY